MPDRAGVARPLEHDEPAGEPGSPIADPLVATMMLLGVGHLLAFVDRTKIAGALPDIRRGIAMTDADAAWVIGTGFAIGYGLALVALTLLGRSRITEGRWRLSAGIAVWALASAATALATTLPALVATRIALGVGQALFIPAALAWIVGASSPATRSTNLSFFTAMAPLGRSVGLLAIGTALAMVAAAGGAPGGAWRWAFVLTVLPNFLLLMLILRARRTGAIAVVDPHAPPRETSVALRTGFLALAVAPIVLIQATLGWLPSLFVRDLGMDARQASLWVGMLILIGGPGGQLAGGVALRRWPDLGRAVPLLVAGAMTATLPCFAMLALGGRATATIGALAAYLLLGIASLSALVGWQRLVAADRRAAGNGLFMALITVVGVGAGPLITGMLADRGTMLRWAMLETALVCASLALLAAALVQPFYRRRLDR